jgi:hypothetical protein
MISKIKKTPRNDTKKLPANKMIGYPEFNLKIRIKMIISDIEEKTG